MTALPFLFRRKNLHFQHETTAHEEHIRTSKNNDEGVYKWFRFYICGSFVDQQ